MNIGELEKALLVRYPSEDAESWDRTGITVGNPVSDVRKVAVALDATVANIKAAAQAGANVLLTHHPLFLDAPDGFVPASSPALQSGAAVYEAINQGVAVMSFHTALDVSVDAQTMLPELLGLSFDYVLEPIREGSPKGYGQFCDALPQDKLTLDALAQRCTDAFSRAPRVWGAGGRQITHVVTCTGSAASTGAAALCAGADVLVCGEIKYHQALDLSQAGLAIIELGHDVSENPFTDVLARVAANVLESKELVTVLDVKPNWH